MNKKLRYILLSLVLFVGTGCNVTNQEVVVGLEEEFTVLEEAKYDNTEWLQPYLSENEDDEVVNGEELANRNGVHVYRRAPRFANEYIISLYGSDNYEIAFSLEEENHSDQSTEDRVIITEGILRFRNTEVEIPLTFRYGIQFNRYDLDDEQFEIYVKQIEMMNVFDKLIHREREFLGKKNRKKLKLIYERLRDDIIPQYKKLENLLWYDYLEQGAPRFHSLSEELEEKIIKEYETWYKKCGVISKELYEMKSNLEAFHIVPSIEGAISTSSLIDELSYMIHFVENIYFLIAPIDESPFKDIYNIDNLINASMYSEAIMKIAQRYIWYM